MGTVLVSAIFEAFATVFRRKSARYFRVAGIAPEDVGRVMMSDDLVKILARGSERRRQPLSRHLHSRHRLLSAGRHGHGRVSARVDHRRHRPRGGRQMVLPRIAHAIVPAPRHFSRRTFRSCRRTPCAGQRPSPPLSIPELAFAKLHFNGDPGHAADEKELLRQAHILGRVRDDAGRTRARCIWSRPVNRCRKTSRTPRRRSSSRCARRAASRRTAASCSTSWPR